MKNFNNIHKQRRKLALSAITEDDKWKLWETALKKQETSLKETLIEENMEYLKWTREQVLDCWGEKGTEKIKKKWIKENPKTNEQLTNYYNTLSLYIPELSSWHAIEKNEDIIKIINFLQFSIKQNFTTYLDFGAGIGSGGIFFNYFGFEITLADISDAMLNYQKWRIKKHNIKACFIDLKKENIPYKSVDCATAIEVLEHVSDPTSEMNTIRLALKKNGYVFITTPFFKDKKRPQHIIHDISIAKEFEKLGFKLISEEQNGLYRVLKKIDLS